MSGKMKRPSRFRISTERSSSTKEPEYRASTEARAELKESKPYTLLSRVVARRATILILREGHLTVARCLEHDIVAQGKSIDEALSAWRDVITSQIAVDLEAGRQPLEWIRPAPEQYFDMFRHARRLESELLRLPDEVPQEFAVLRLELRVC